MESKVASIGGFHSMGRTWEEVQPLLTLLEGKGEAVPLQARGALRVPGS